MIRRDFSHITDARGRHVRVESTTLPVRLAKADSADPKLRKAVQFRRELDSLSSAVRRLAPPSAAHPDKFHEERSDIARRLQQLAAQLDEAG